MRSENKRENDYCDWLRDEYPREALALKLVFFVGAGWPDRTILSEGKIFFIEFKKPVTGRLLASQIKWRGILTRLGFKVYVCESFREAKKITLAHLGSP